MPQQAPDPDAGALPGALRGSSHRFPCLAWLLALVWSAITAGVLYADLRPAQGVAPWVAWVALGVFALPGLFLIWYCLSATVRFARYRALRLELNRLPATTGSVIAGALDVPVTYDPAHRYAVRLEAIEYRRDGSARRNMVPHVRHQEDIEARAAPGTRGTRLRFALRIPAEAPPSQSSGATLRWIPATRERAYLHWTLCISAEVPGVDLKEEFEIPVRRATAARAALAADPPPAASSSALLPAPSGRLSYESAQEGGRWVIRQPPWKGTPPSHALALMAYFGLFYLVGLGAAYLGAWLVGGVFAAIGLYFASGVLVLAASGLRAEISRDGVLITRSLWDLRLKHVVLDRARIASVEVLVETGPGGGAPDRSVVVREHSGVVHCVAESMPTARESEALRDQVIARLGLLASTEAGSAARAAAAAAARQSQRRIGAAKSAVILGAMVVLAAYFLHPEWFSYRNSAQVAAQSVPATGVTSTALPPESGVEQAMLQASRLADRGDLNAAIAHLGTAIRVAREENGEAHPMEAYVLYRRAQAQRRARNVAAAMESLDDAVRIMERHRPADARRMLGTRAGEFDKELLARYGGEFLWDERRYEDAHVYYVKAWEAGLEVEVNDVERNLRRATSSAGVMVTACMLGKWELADGAMAELKERYKRVTPSAKEGLKYWIDSGEPRLKTRKC